MTIRRTLPPVLAAVFLAILAPTAVLAHADLIAAFPEPDSTVSELPLEITATFDEELAIEQSDMSLRNAAGDRIARGRVDPAEPTVLRMAPPPDLAPGEYEVRWVAGSADGHIERGSWQFTFAPAASPSPTPSPSPSPVESAGVPPATSPSPPASPSPDRSDSQAPSASPSPGSDASDASGAVAPIIGAVVVLAGLGLWLARRRTP